MCASVDIATLQTTIADAHEMANTTSQTRRDSPSSPIAGVIVEQVPFDAPWNWLAAGWRDVWAAPRISLAYGVLFALLSVGLMLGLLVTGLPALMLVLAGGFLLVGPVAAVGLYEASRRLEAGRSVDFGEVILAFLYFVWLQLAFLLFMLFLGGRGLPPPSEFLPALLFTLNGLSLLVVGAVVGGVVATVAFAISVISVPLLLTRRADAVTAIAASLAAVVLNPKPMALSLWAALIAGFMVLGIATLSVGLIFAFPLIGHATWHAYRELVRVPDFV